ncbi:flagellar motor protein MotB [Nannocystis sp.]|uniref:OmpA/MotB family protein n=1 Tax=Nannocystis sp. TaxID=1962667 RepID=UPI0024234FE1|nr:flagellar motor protein MotB [Nannocystis sp.]MBK7826286.1 flagellar motor protein MotB [Nannocystis sp.]MBK9758201.1 flagellar motor protein MotB [Nannocystis sp.]
MPRLPLLLAVLLTSGCVTRTRYDALAEEREQARQALLGEQEAARQQAARCAQELADAGALTTKCEARAVDLNNEILRQAAAARANELEAQDLKADLRTQQELLARLVKDRSQLKSTVDEMRGALAAAAEREREAARRVAEFKDMLARFKDLIDAGKLQVRVVDGRMVLTLPMDILFPSGSAKLGKDGRDALLEVGRGLATIPERRFQVEGHTDDVPIHTAAYASNWELAAARALGVVRALLEAGMAPQRVSAASFSEYRPTAANDGDANRGRNRRIEIVVVPDLTGLPGFRELQQLAGGK